MELTRLFCLALVSLLLAACEQKRTLENVDYTTAVAQYKGLYLPADATHIHAYEQVGGLQSLQRYYSFVVEPERVNAAMNEVTAACEKEMGLTYPFKTSAIDASTHLWPKSIKAEIPWWQPDAIKDGYYKGASMPYAVSLWADKESGRIYVYQSD